MLLTPSRRWGNSRKDAKTQSPPPHPNPPMNPHPGPLPSDGRGRVFGRLAGKVAAVHGFKARAVVGGILSPALSPLVPRGAREKTLGRPVYPGLRSFLAAPWATIMSFLRDHVIPTGFRFGPILNSSNMKPRMTDNTDGKNPLHEPSPRPSPIRWERESFRTSCWKGPGSGVQSAKCNLGEFSPRSFLAGRGSLHLVVVSR